MEMKFDTEMVGPAMAKTNMVKKALLCTSLFLAVAVLVWGNTADPGSFSVVKVKKKHGCRRELENFDEASAKLDDMDKFAMTEVKDMALNLRGRGSRSQMQALWDEFAGWVQQFREDLNEICGGHLGDLGDLSGLMDRLPPKANAHRRASDASVSQHTAIYCEMAAFLDRYVSVMKRGESMVVHALTAGPGKYWDYYMDYNEALVYLDLVYNCAFE